MLEKVKRSGFPEFYFVLNLIFHVTKKKSVRLTVCAAKPGSLWVLDFQLETEIHSFSESPPLLRCIKIP